MTQTGSLKPFAVSSHNDELKAQSPDPQALFNEACALAMAGDVKTSNLIIFAGKDNRKRAHDCAQTCGYDTIDTIPAGRAYNSLPLFQTLGTELTYLTGYLLAMRLCMETTSPNVRTFVDSEYDPLITVRTTELMYLLANPHVETLQARTHEILPKAAFHDWATPHLLHYLKILDKARDHKAFENKALSPLHEKFNMAASLEQGPGLKPSAIHELRRQTLPDFALLLERLKHATSIPQKIRKEIPNLSHHRR